MPEESVLKNRWVRAVLALLACIALVVMAWLLSPVLVPLFFAFIAAYVLDPVVDFFERRRVRRMVTTLALAMLGLGIFISIPIYLATGVVQESQQLIQIARERMNEAQKPGTQSRFDSLIKKLPLENVVEALGWAPHQNVGEEDTADGPEESPAESEQGDELLSAAAEEDESASASPEDEAEDENPPYDPLAVILERVGTRIQEDALQLVQNYGTRAFQISRTAGANVAGVVASAGRTAMDIFLAIGSFFLFAFVAGYLLRDYDNIIATADELLPQAYRPRIRSIMIKIDGHLRGFMRGQALVALFIGVMYTIGFSIAGIPFGLALGVLGGVANFIPYLGLILTILPTTILCIVQHGGIDWHAAVLAATFIVAQSLEGTVITPKVVGDQVGLGPVWVILAILVFGNALGLLGMLLAVPVAATLKVLIGEALVEYKKSKFYTGQPKIPPGPV